MWFIINFLNDTGCSVTMPGMIIFWLLFVLIDECMNQITYPDRQIIQPAGRTARIKCTVDKSTLQSNAIHVYRTKSGAGLERIMHFGAGETKGKNDAGFDRRFTGSVTVSRGLVTLAISPLKSDDAGMYYCALWSSDRKVFGSGTRLYVTDKTTVEPDLTAYSPSEKHDKKSTMLCQASGMFPDLVKFSWKTESSSGNWNEVPNEHVVEQRDEKNNEIFVTSMVIVDKDTAKNNNYQCIVEHEGNKKTTKTAIVKRDKDESSEKKPEDDTPNPTCPPSENTKQNLESLDQTPSFYLFVYAYGIMLMKNGVYFAAVCIFLLKRKAGKKDESSQKPSK
ncbi:immunoglobulin kappa light chain-like isoform X2 [Triplophysa rosa]|uniref:immunoglobulin kappa light chain-like isoform X2 n=1 Tax=Triplophysa rosa TaxID=992332 RepID=UPI002545EB00|nr:immunoglobulin kappa light chain-like isoform X2 [Triplophysa rosa]